MTTLSLVSPPPNDPKTTPLPPKTTLNMGENISKETKSTPTALTSTSITENLLSLIDKCDSFPYNPSATQEYWLFALLSDWNPTCTKLQTCGYIPSFVVTQMPWTPSFNINQAARIVSIPYSAAQSETQIIAELLALARAQQSFEVLTGWRDELYPILNVAGRPVAMERAASCLFGIATRGVHCTAYMYTTATAETTTTSPPQKQLKLIIPRRAATKSTYPSMLDNTIAGGISSTEHPWLAHQREAHEEAGLPPRISRRAIPTGTISYTHIRDSRAGGETGLVQPECQFCYDLELRPDLDPAEMPTVNDDEVAGFEVMGLQEAWRAMLADRFKPNCGIVLLDFFVRWGFVRAGRDAWVPEDPLDEHEHERERDCGGEGEKEGFEIPAQEYAELVARMHRRVVFEDASARLR